MKLFQRMRTFVKQWFTIEPVVLVVSFHAFVASILALYAGIYFTNHRSDWWGGFIYTACSMYWIYMAGIEADIHRLKAMKKLLDEHARFLNSIMPPRQYPGLDEDEERVLARYEEELRTPPDDKAP